ncbi:MAG: hypothetical protein WCD76_21760 [Pyrinomonadaceae bacterium]
MKTRHTKFTPGPFAIPVALFVVVFSSTAQSYAQGSKTVPQRGTGTTEQQIRSLEIESKQKRDAGTIMGEINEDFGRLRVINDEIKKASLPGEALNYKSISETSAEIKKRVARLKTNLSGLPKAEKDEKRQKENMPLDETQMKALLSSLNTTISSLVSNPVFSDMGSLDNRLAVKARLDLEGAIMLSEVAKKGAEKLGKHP